MGKKDLKLNKEVTQTYPVKCRGRNDLGEEVLKDSVNVEVKIHTSPGSNIISSNVRCQYNTGGHGQRCKATHPNVDKVGEGIGCPYSLDIPYAMDNAQREGKESSAKISDCERRIDEYIRQVDAFKKNRRN